MADTIPLAAALRGVSRAYDGRRAVDGVDLVLEPGRITCLLGPSGCGKSTLLRLLAGLEPVDEGEIKAGGVLLSAPGRLVPPERRRIGLVFQDFALFPHLDAAANVAFGLSARPRTERRARATALLERFRLADRAGAYPHMLSGGEQQRVAIARALAPEPAALLLDEPFSGLDGALKAEVRQLAMSALRDQGAAVLIVTHDPEEAMLTGDRLALMAGGRILQADTPATCYARPASLTAARLLGQVNALPARIGNGRAETLLGPLPAPDRSDGAALALIRPEALRFAADGAEGRTIDARFGGAFWESRVAIGERQVTIRSADPPPEPGHVAVAADPQRVWFVDPEPEDRSEPVTR